MGPGTLLGIVAALYHIVAYTDYNRQVRKGNTAPNGATWLIWAVLSGLNGSTYTIMTDDWVKAYMPIVNIFLCIGTFLYIALILRKFEWPDPWDLLALVVGILAGLAWIYFNSATYANLIMQFAIFCGFVPTYRGVFNNPEAEHFRPWVIWIIAYSTLSATVVSRWQGQWQDLVYPVNCVVLHILVIVIALVGSRLKVKVATTST